MAALPRLESCSSATAALAALGEGMIDIEKAVTHCTALDAAEVPEPFRTLLVHEEHMTAVLQQHCGQRVTLRILRQTGEDEEYRREILLILPDGRTAVEYGLVRMDLRVFDPRAREEVLSGRTPLGDILIMHDVLRKVVPQWYLRFSGEAPLLRYFGPPRPAEAYGRIGTIYVEQQPAIELLEIVSGKGRLA
ncbi:MAG: hypothetical protein J5J06_11855 [Phycisphaerae bacterium]|nr:hypothetical protein [Phycisphaerae bacterium]